MTDVSTEPTAAPKPQGRGKIYIAVGAILALAAGVAVIWISVLGPRVSPADVTVQGDLHITGASLDWGRTTGQCVGSGGYDDVHDGTQVVISDADGTTIAVGSLGTGVPIGSTIRNKPAACEFPFKVTAPGGHDFYGVTIGRRGTMKYAVADLAGELRLSLS